MGTKVIQEFQYNGHTVSARVESGGARFVETPGTAPPTGPFWSVTIDGVTAAQLEASPDDTEQEVTQRLKRLVDDQGTILAALSSAKYTWRTIDGIAGEIGLAPERVIQIVQSSSDKVIRSRVPDAMGNPLYTSREHYKETHSPLARFFYQMRSTST